MKGMGLLASSVEHGVDLLLMHYADSVLLLGLLLLWRGDLLLMHYADSVLLLGLLLLWQGDLLLMHYADSVLLLGLLLLWRLLLLRCLKAPWATVHSFGPEIWMLQAFLDCSKSS